MNRTVPISLVMLVLLWCAGCKTAPNDAPDPAPPSSPLTPSSPDALNDVVPDGQLTAADAQALEATLTGEKGELKARINLLWHYRNQFADPAATRNANSHLLWIVTHHPDAKVLGAPIAQLHALPADPTVDAFSKLWIDQAATHRNNARVQGHAGLFFESIDAERAIRLLELANALDKDEPVWLEHLGDLYASRGKAETVYGKWFDKAEQAYATALPLLKSPRSKRQLLPKLASVQLRMGQLDAAGASAEQLAALLVKESGNTSDLAVARHDLHVIRGAVAVGRGAIGDAEAELSKAGDTLRDQRVSLWQLDMMLAVELHQRKRHLAVIRYLDCVHRATGNRTVEGWITKLKRDEPIDMKDYRH